MTLTVEIPAELVDFVQRMLKEDRFLSASDLLIEALHCYVREAAFIDASLDVDEATAVREAADELDRDPGSAVPIEDVIARFRSRRETFEKLSA